MSDICWVGVFQETICKILSDVLAYCVRPSGGMADAGDLKSPARNGRVGSNPTSAITEDRSTIGYQGIRDYWIRKPDSLIT